MKRLNDAENRPTTGAHRDAMTQKLFLVAALLGYFNLAVCSFVIIPFQDSILAWLEGGGGGGAGGNGGGGAALMGFLVSLKRAMLGDDAVGVAASATMSGPDTLATRLVFYLVTGQVSGTNFGERID